MDVAIFLYLVGLVLMAVELFVPGGIVGTIGFLCCIAAIIIAWHDEWYYGAIGLVVVLVLTPSMIMLALRRLSLRKTLVKGDATEGTKADYDALLNNEGVAKSSLRPAGIGVFDGRRVNVVTRGEMLDTGDKIQVISVEGNRVVVKKLD